MPGTHKKLKIQANADERILSAHIFPSGKFSRNSLKFHRGWVYFPVLIALGLALVLAVSFAGIAQRVVTKGGAGPLDLDISWALYMKDMGELHPHWRMAMISATNLGSVLFLATLALAGVVWQIWQGNTRLAVAWCLIAAGGGGLNNLLKNSFDRERPPLEWRDPVIFENNESFPSGHSMGSIIGYGLLAYALVMQKWRPLWTGLAIVPIVLLVPTIGFSRIFLRAHWVTDVLAGFLIGGAWLTLGLGLLESWRREGPVNVKSTRSP